MPKQPKTNTANDKVISMNTVKAMTKRVFDMAGVGASALSQRMGIASLLGYSHNMQRDLYASFGYKRVISFRESWQRYRRQDIASRIIDAPVNALWSNPPAVKSTSDAWNKVWNDLVINKGLWRVISRVDKMCGLGDYAVLLVGLDNTTNLSETAEGTGEHRVIYMQPYDYGSSQIVSLVNDPSSPRFMKPLLYRVQSALTEQSKPVGFIPPLAFGVHWSRILHVAENILSDEIFGNPRMERVWNLLDDLLKVTGGTAETYWITANKGMQVDVDKEMDMTPEDEDALTEEIEEYINQLRRVIRTRGVKITNLGTDVPQPQQIFIMIIQLIASATGIPMRILLGSEAGQLASGQDRNNWAERIKERRAEFGEPVIIWPLIKMLTKNGVLPADDNIQISIVWPDAYPMTPSEVAQAISAKALAANNLSKTLQQAPKFISNDEARAILGLDVTPMTIDNGTLTEDKDPADPVETFPATATTTGTK